MRKSTSRAEGPHGEELRGLGSQLWLSTNLLAVSEMDAPAPAEPADISQSRDKPFLPSHPKLQIYGLHDWVVCSRAIRNRCSALPASLPPSLPVGASETLTAMSLPIRTLRSPALLLLCHTWCGGVSEKLERPWAYPSEVLPSYHLPCLQLGHLISSLKNDFWSHSSCPLFPPPELPASLLDGTGEFHK